MIAITGATGHIGGRVARTLAADGLALRLVVRDPSRAPDLRGTDVRRAEYRDGDAVRRALDGADVVLMVSAAEAVDRRAEHRTFVEAAAEVGVAHLVYTSFLAAGPTATFTLARDHWATEEHIRASGLPFTFLRDNLYADFLPRMIGPDDVLRGPAGQGRVSAVAQADVAAVAARVLTQPEPHRGQTYDLTGPQALTLDDVAQIVREQTGRAVRYEPETVEAAYASRTAFDAPPWQLAAWVSTYTAIATGELAPVSDAVPRLTGRPATPLAAVIRPPG